MRGESDMMTRDDVGRKFVDDDGDVLTLVYWAEGAGRPCIMEWNSKLNGTKCADAFPANYRVTPYVPPPPLLERWLAKCPTGVGMTAFLSPVTAITGEVVGTTALRMIELPADNEGKTRLIKYIEGLMT
jgi:hypothetical protein